MEIRYFAKHAMKNRKDIETAGNAGCFSCLKIFSASDIKEYTDKDETAICPYCQVDSLVPDYSENPLNYDFLMKAKKYWF